LPRKIISLYTLSPSTSRSSSIRYMEYREETQFASNYEVFPISVETEWRIELPSAHSFVSHSHQENFTT
jgi:hypothetical protein